MYDLITVNGGHSPYSVGASGNGYKEHEIVRIIKDKLISAFNSVGQATYDTTSDAKTKSLVLKEQVDKCNNFHDKVKKQLNLSIHLNAGGGTGVEVLYYSQYELATVLSKEISKVMGLRNRGAKERKDLYFLSKTKAPSLLLELCFIDNVNDMKVLMSKIDSVVSEIVKTLTGKTVQEKIDGKSGQFYRVITGSFNDRKNAEKRVSELKIKGFESFIEIK